MVFSFFLNNILISRIVYICICMLSQQNFNRETQFVVLKNLSEDVIILSMPNAADAGIVAVLLFV